MKRKTSIRPKSEKAKKPDLPSLLDNHIPEEIPQDAEVERLATLLSFRQKNWADFYVKTLNKKKASMLVGCTEPNANTYAAYMWGMPKVRDYVQAVLNATLGGIEDNVKFIQNIRDASLNDYLSVTRKTKSDLIEIPILKYIDQVQIKLDFEQEYLMDVASEPREITESVKLIKSLERQIKKLHIEARHYPNKKIITYGPEYIAEDVELDLVKLAKDQDGGKLKSFKTTKDGIQVEFYSSLDAAAALARIQGADKGISPVTIKTGPSAEELSRLSEDDLRKMAEIEKKMRGIAE